MNVCPQSCVCLSCQATAMRGDRHDYNDMKCECNWCLLRTVDVRTRDGVHVAYRRRMTPAKRVRRIVANAAGRDLTPVERQVVRDPTAHLGN